MFKDYISSNTYNNRRNYIMFTIHNTPMFYNTYSVLIDKICDNSYSGAYIKGLLLL